MNNDEKKRIRKLARTLPVKYRIRVLNLVNTRSVAEAKSELHRCYAHVNREPPHPIISTGEAKQTLGVALRVQELTKKGFSVGNIAKELGLKRRRVLAIRQKLQRKQDTVVACTPTTVPPPGLSKKQTHAYRVAVALPFTREYRDDLQQEYVYNFQRNKGVDPYQDHFELNPQVSVRATNKKLHLTIKNVWDETHDQGDEQARLIAMEAIQQLAYIYGFEWGDTVHATFNGAEWALVGHDLAKALKKEHARFYMVYNGQKIAWNDPTPGQSWELGHKEKAKLSGMEEVARVYMGFTAKKFATVMKMRAEATIAAAKEVTEATKLFAQVTKQQADSSVLVAQSLTTYLRMKTEDIKQRMPNATQTQPLTRSDYIG